MPILPRLPRGLVVLLILSLVVQAVAPLPTHCVNPLPSLSVAPSSHPCRVRVRSLQRIIHPRLAWDAAFAILSRLGARSALLAVLLHTSGWLTLMPGAITLLLLPVLQAGLTWSLRTQPAPRSSRRAPWSRRLQRLYQLMFAFLLASTVLQGLSFVYHLSLGIG